MCQSAGTTTILHNPVNAYVSCTFFSWRFLLSCSKTVRATPLGPEEPPFSVSTTPGTTSEILHNCDRDALVLEPFSGTGTTLLAATELGLRCHAVDINPFLVWLAALKVSHFPAGTPRIIEGVAREIVSAARRRSSRAAAWLPDISNIEKWWDKQALEKLSALFHGVNTSADSEKSHLTSLLRIAFCRVLIETANVSFGHQSMSFKKRVNTDQMPLFDLQHLPDPVWDGFLHAVAEIGESIEGDMPRTIGRIVLGDSRHLPEILPSRSYTTVITSPPYPNRMSYIRELRPYMYWLGYLRTGRQAGELDWQSIGGTWGCATSLLDTWQPSLASGIPFKPFNDIVSKISQRNKLLGRYVHKYFEDIRSHIHSVRSVLAARARCYYVVGNSKFYDTLLPVQEIYAALFRDAGFVNTEIQTIRKRTSKRELFEYVVYAEAP